MTEKCYLEIKLSSTYESVALAARALKGIMESSGFDASKCQDVELCFVEIANNVVEHAYCDANDRLFRIGISLEQASILISIIDNGNTMDSKYLEVSPVFKEPDVNDPESWTTSGRGIQIVLDIMDEVTYSTENGENTFAMRKNK